jgi:hypothetical protein
MVGVGCACTATPRARTTTQKVAKGRGMQFKTEG